MDPEHTDELDLTETAGVSEATLENSLHECKDRLGNRRGPRLEGVLPDNPQDDPERGSSETECGPSRTEGRPSEMERGPSGLEGGPSETEGGPSEMEREPSRSEGRPSETERGPSGLEGRPNETEHGPSGSEGEPNEMEREPSGSEGRPSETERGPSETERGPSGSEGRPSASEGRPSGSEEEVAGMSEADKPEKDTLAKAGRESLRRGRTGSYRCSQSAKDFISLPELRHHEWAHTGERPFIRRSRGKSLSQMFDLQRHAGAHRDWWPRQCGKPLLSGPAWRERQQVPADQWACRQAPCDRILTRVSALSNPGGPAQCPDYGTSFRRRAVLRDHQRLRSTPCARPEHGQTRHRPPGTLRTEDKPHRCAVVNQARARPCAFSPCGLSLDRRHRLKQHQGIPSAHGESHGVGRAPATGLERRSRVYRPEPRPFANGKAGSQISTLQRHKCFLPKGQEAAVGRDGGPSWGADWGPDGGLDRPSDGGAAMDGGPGQEADRLPGTDGGVDGGESWLPDGGPGRGADGGAKADGGPDRGADGAPDLGVNRGPDGGLDRLSDRGVGTDGGPGRGADGGLGAQGEAERDHPHSCSQCDGPLGQQCQRLRDPGGRPFACADCGKAFTRLRGLQDHQRIHSGERPFLCGQCGKAFTRMSALRVHLQAHGGARPYHCSLCGMKFAFGSRLRRHMRTHTGERPYVCAQCGVAFAQSSNLKDHQRSHSGEKPHVCRECGRAFVSSSTLVKHLRTHTGEKPYTCRLCGKSFTQSSTLKRHKCLVAQRQRDARESGSAAAEETERAEEEILCICECGKPYVKRGRAQPQQCPHTAQGHCKSKEVP
uniref:zinc finger protein 420-like n=1 Tax=Pristiophorus japonicus TaxID=55135 RepID=UPI00398F3B5E